MRKELNKINKIKINQQKSEIIEFTTKIQNNFINKQKSLSISNALHSNFFAVTVECPFPYSIFKKFMCIFLDDPFITL